MSDPIKLGAEGRAARDWLRAALPVGAEVVIRTHKDATEKYGRLLAQVWTAKGAVVDDDSLNLQMIALGLARAYYGGAR